MLDYKRTGRTRHRVHSRKFKRDLLVLQLEVEGLVPDHCGGMVDVSFKKWWVDARTEWITESEASDEV